MSDASFRVVFHVEPPAYGGFRQVLCNGATHICLVRQHDSLSAANWGACPGGCVAQDREPASFAQALAEYLTPREESGS